MEDKKNPNLFEKKNVIIMEFRMYGQIILALSLIRLSENRIKKIQLTNRNNIINR